MWQTIAGAAVRVVAGGAAEGAAAGGARALATRAAPAALGSAVRSAGGRLASKATQVVAQAGKRYLDSAVAAAENASAMDVLREVKEQLPRFSHAITVNVRGGPRADLRRIWWLACAACFGRYKRGVLGVWGRSLNAQWNITGKEVSITLAYTFSGIIENFYGGLTDNSPLGLLQRGPDQVTIGEGWPAWMLTTTQNLGPAGVANAVGGIIAGGLVRLATGLIPAMSPTTLWQYQSQLAGISQAVQELSLLSLGQLRLDAPLIIQNRDTPGGDVYARILSPWRVRVAPNVLRELPLRTGFGGEILPYRRLASTDGDYTGYVLRGSGLGFVPILPDDGRVITTGEKRDPRVQPPRPPVDGVSRGDALAMITAALGSPGVLVEPPEPTATPLAGGGLYAHAPGSGVSGVGRLKLPTVLGRPDPSIIGSTLVTVIDQTLDRNEVPRRVINVEE